jgi:hypothetical protein
MEPVASANEEAIEEISLRRCDLPYTVGSDLDEAVDLMMSLGPAGS